MALNQFPYSDFHEMNLDWLLCEVNKLKKSMHDFKIANALHIEGAWSINKAYQAYSIVTDNNLGYISLKAVPAGISVNNTEYWQNIADFTALYADLGNRVTALETSNTSIVNQLPKIKKNSWSDRRVLWVGDSYGTGWTGTTGVTDPYAIASNLLGCSYVNVSHGGNRFGVASTDPQYQYITYIDSYVNSHSDMNSFTDVIIIGGANDVIFNPNENIQANITTTINYVKQHFPNARIHIGMIARLANTRDPECKLGATYKIINQYKRGAFANGVHYINDSELINHNYSLFNTDGIHLTSYQAMGENLASLLISDTFTRFLDVATSLEVIETSDSNSLAPTTLTTTNTIQRGSDIVFDISDLSFNFSNPVSIGWNKTYKIARVSGTANTRNIFCAGPKAIRLNIPGVIKYNVGGTNYVECQPFTFYLYDDYLYMSWEGLTTHGGATLSSVSEIHFRSGFEFILNENLC